MELCILAIGKCRDKPILDLVGMYATRLKPYHTLRVEELTPKNTGKKPEAEALLGRIPPQAAVIAMDERGKSLNTPQFAEKFQNWADQGIRQIYFIIGGADGLDESVRQRADLVLALSAMTFPHMLVRPILAEQLYRAATLNAGHPYHRV